MNKELLEQGSAAWLQARCGSLGASQVHDIMARTKSGWSASRGNVMAQLVLERITGEPQDTYQSAAMLHGILTEPEARAAYEFYRDVEVVEVGLIVHPSILGTHASPDGLIGDDGVLEIKCMQPKGHIEILESEKIIPRYLTQMQWQIGCTGRQWADFVAYQPAFPESMRLIVHRIERDDKMIAELEKEVREFLAGVDAKVQALLTRYEQAA